jgi:hypothetical protein
VLVGVTLVLVHLIHGSMVRLIKRRLRGGARLDVSIGEGRPRKTENETLK